ncbi:MAG: FAD-dependent oxidoreductase [Candidatus Sulfopaludibacter sp.]|nr:FAD-dependent oxidoreductase [Candidatus Sulfopaludibacter sp.]
MTVETTCCVVGGGPAGVMLGYLLARKGIGVKVLEKHADFFRDFRGDTVHPSTLEVLDELDLLDEFLKLPHQRAESAGGVFGDFEFLAADFRFVPARCKFVAFMPQWDFLNFLSEKARRYPGFDLRLHHEVTDLILENGRVAGVMALGPDGDPVAVRADLVVGCDGRHAVTRRAAGLELLEFGAPMDVLWFRISRNPGDPRQVFGRLNYGRMLILIDRSEYFQAGLIIPKGSFDEIKNAGLDRFRAGLRRIAPFLDGRTDEIQSWDQVRILTVQLNRLRRWYREGLLCIGDAAHAMSPVGGVGINLAIQDAVAAANLLALPLKERRATAAVLASVQKRREFPARVTQAVQALAHRGAVKIFRQRGPLQAPWQLKAAVRIPGVHVALGYAVGMGVRPEHVGRRGERDGHTLPMVFGFAVGLAAALTVLSLGRRKARHARATLQSHG